MKYRIEKNTVQETLVIPLYGRKVCTELYPDLYHDETAQKLIEKVDYDFSALEEKSKKTMYILAFWKSRCGKTIFCGKSRITLRRIRRRRW